MDPKDLDLLNIDPKALDLLKRRYRLAESLIQHALSNPIMQISGEKMIEWWHAMRTPERLNDQYKELALRKLHVHYVDYMSMSSMARTNISRRIRLVQQPCCKRQALKF